MFISYRVDADADRAKRLHDMILGGQARTVGMQVGPVPSLPTHRAVAACSVLSVPSRMPDCTRFCTEALGKRVTSSVAKSALPYFQP